MFRPVTYPSQQILYLYILNLFYNNILTIEFVLRLYDYFQLWNICGPCVIAHFTTKFLSIFLIFFCNYLLNTE
jgi:hypothetical protein